MRRRGPGRLPPDGGPPPTADRPGEVPRPGMEWPVPPPGVALFDYDGDGWLDIFVDSLKGRPSYLYRNNRDGTYTDVAAQVGLQDIKGNGRGVAAADFNNDGWTDLYVGNAGSAGDNLDYR